jgi:hypothetical protein
MPRLINHKRAFAAGIAFACLVAAGTVAVANAQEDVTLHINPTLPGSSGVTDPAGMVVGFYEFALLVGALLAFGAIIYGAVMYTLATDNPSAKSNAKDWILQPLLGLLLLAGAYLVLFTISPTLVHLGLPALPKLKPPTTNQTNATSTLTSACVAATGNYMCDCPGSSGSLCSGKSCVQIDYKRCSQAANP